MNLQEFICDFSSNTLDAPATHTATHEWPSMYLGEYRIIVCTILDKTSVTVKDRSDKTILQFEPFFTKSPVTLKVAVAIYNFCKGAKTE